MGINRRDILADRLATVGRAFYEAGWMRGTAGNLSARISGGNRYVITASGGQKGELDRRNFVELTVGMKQQSPPRRKYSAETIVHDKLYAADATIGSILHIHGPFLTLVSRTVSARENAEIAFQSFEYIKGLGLWGPNDQLVVPIVPNHADIPQLAEAVVESKTTCPAVIVESHGVYAWGTDIDAARRHIECLEFLAEMRWRETACA